ncbi:MAG: helix-turn-helix transcriptional regulator [Gemmatimonadota bacterium]
MSADFHYSRHDARGAAAAVVEESWTMCAARCRTLVEAALPDACAEIYFNLGSGGRHVYTGCAAAGTSPRAAWVVGPRARNLLVAKEVIDCDIVGLRLRAGAVAQVLGVAASELREQMVDLDVFWGSAVDRIRDQLHATRASAARVSIVQRALLQHVARRSVEGELARTHSLCCAVAATSRSSITAVAAAHGLSHRQLIALFEREVGLKPKQFQRVQRLRSVLEAIGESTRPPWAQLAVRHGYTDQSHLIHEFNQLTGITPGHYVSNRSQVGDGFVPHMRVASD